MRLRTFLTGAVVLASFGVLGFRILDLEQRVALLSEQAGVPERVEVEAKQASGSASSAPDATRKTYEQRLRALETRLDSLLSEQKSGRSPAADEPSASALAKEQAILSVVERENLRIREVQLEWHRARWLEGREQALVVFASQQKLQAGQTAELHKALEREVDGMVKVLKRPELIDDPEQAVGEWQSVLAATDESAQKILTPEQHQVWWQARLMERRVLWPWLPQEQGVRK